MTDTTPNESGGFRAILMVNLIKSTGDRGLNPQVAKVEVSAKTLDDLKDKVKKHVDLI